MNEDWEEAAKILEQIFEGDNSDYLVIRFCELIGVNPDGFLIGGGILCEYCGQEFTGSRADGNKSRHKAKCSQKRYLGGELIMETAEDPTELLEIERGKG